MNIFLSLNDGSHIDFLLDPSLPSRKSGLLANSETSFKPLSLNAKCLSHVQKKGPARLHPSRSLSAVISSEAIFRSLFCEEGKYPKIKSGIWNPETIDYPETGFY